MPHIEHLVHFFPWGLAFGLYKFKKWWHLEQIVFYNVKVFNKMKDFCLCPPAAMYHAVDLGAANLREDFLYDRRIRPGGGKHEFSGIQWTVGNRVFQFFGA